MGEQIWERTLQKVGGIARKWNGVIARQGWEKAGEEDIWVNS
jgi:hypothetical protein